jgi:hypothetical protein
MTDIATYDEVLPELEALHERFDTPGTHRSAIVGIQRVFEPIHPLAITAETMGLPLKRPRWFDEALDLLAQSPALSTLIMVGEFRLRLADGVSEELIEQVRENLSTLPVPSRRGYTPRMRR